MRHANFKFWAFSASVQSKVLVSVAGIALAFHLSKSTAQEAGQKQFESAQAVGAQVGDNTEAVADENWSARALQDRRDFTGRQLFEHIWEGASNPPAVQQASTRTRFRSDSHAIIAMGDGLGPLYNAKSCAECHTSGGGSGVKQNVVLLTLDPHVRPCGDHEKFASRLRDVFPGLIAPGGVLAYNTVVHNFSTRPGYNLIRDRLATYIDGGIEPEWYAPDQRTSKAIARRPVLPGRYLDIDFYLSQRNSPPLFGLGSIDQIPLRQLVLLAEQQASKSGGKITGRVAGKLGWQGQSSSLLSFVASACAVELGLSQETMAQTPDHADNSYVNPSIDMFPGETIKIANYISTIPRPREVRSETETFWHERAGEKTFNAIGCVDCHVADVRPAKGIFSDLLLHDMGERLQGPFPITSSSRTVVGSSSTFTPATLKIRDAPRSGTGASSGNYDQGGFGVSLPEPYSKGRPVKPQFPRVEDTSKNMDFSSSYPSSPSSWEALQREWKTPPLWGVRDSGPYLHDGRAITIEEAIEWHGGESEDSRVAFERLSRKEKDSILSFLNSLQAPDVSD
jgi:CxxC motif-containing protein (DUF1111 family)